MFFNAHHTRSASEGKQKQKAPNALVPSAIAYAGDQMDFTVDMGEAVGCTELHLQTTIANFCHSVRHD